MEPVVIRDDEYYKNLKTVKRLEKQIDEDKQQLKETKAYLIKSKERMVDFEKRIKATVEEDELEYLNDGKAELEQDIEDAFNYIEELELNIEDYKEKLEKLLKKIK